MPARFQPSNRLRIANAVARAIAKPRLKRTETPQEGRREFETLARWLFRRPPFLLRRRRRSTADSPEMHWVTCGRAKRKDVILYLHGGAYFAGSPATHEGLVGTLSALTGMEAVIPVYARAPEHQAPAAYDDACRAHEALCAAGYPPDRIVLAGDSSGGGLAMALLARLCEAGMQPACVVAMSPWVDLTMISASLLTNAEADALLPSERMPEVVSHVLGSGAGALQAGDVRVSPVYATFDAPPPVLIQVGSTEILRDDAVRMAARLRQGGGRVDLRLWPEAIHVWQLLGGYLPEARDALAEAAAFILQEVGAST